MKSHRSTIRHTLEAPPAILWSWVERVEAAMLEDAFGGIAGSEDENSWRGQGLAGAGAYRLLQLDHQGDSGNSTNDTEERVCEALSCNVYDSPGRRYVHCAGEWLADPIQ